MATAPLSSRMSRSLATGWPVSSGRYGRPAYHAPSMAAIPSADRRQATATGVSPGPPVACATRAAMIKRTTLQVGVADRAGVRTVDGDGVGGAGGLVG